MGNMIILALPCQSNRENLFFHLCCYLSMEAPCPLVRTLIPTQFQISLFRHVSPGISF